MLQDEVEGKYEQLNASLCSMLHPEAPPCKFWSKRYGAVPDAVSRLPLNDIILCQEFLVWPPVPGPESGELSLTSWCMMQNDVMMPCLAIAQMTTLYETQNVHGL